MLPPVLHRPWECSSRWTQIPLLGGAPTSEHGEGSGEPQRPRQQCEEISCRVHGVSCSSIQGHRAQWEGDLPRVCWSLVLACWPPPGGALRVHIRVCKKQQKIDKRFPSCAVLHTCCSLWGKIGSSSLSSLLRIFLLQRPPLTSRLRAELPAQALSILSCFNFIPCMSLAPIMVFWGRGWGLAGRLAGLPLHCQHPEDCLALEGAWGTNFKMLISALFPAASQPKLRFSLSFCLVLSLWHCSWHWNPGPHSAKHKLPWASQIPKFFRALFFHVNLFVVFYHLYAFTTPDLTPRSQKVCFLKVTLSLAQCLLHSRHALTTFGLLVTTFPGTRVRSKIPNVLTSVIFWGLTWT